MQTIEKTILGSDTLRTNEQYTKTILNVEQTILAKFDTQRTIYKKGATLHQG